MNEPAAELRRNGAILLALVAALAGWLCFARLDEPRAPVWDEAYYLTSTARYHQGLTQFSSHPPLGTMLIAAGDMASGRNAHADWRTIGAEKKISAEAIPAGFDYAGPRLAPALFGTLAALLFAALMLELTGSALAAGLLSLLLLADTALLVQFRSAQLDAFQLGFVLAGLLAAVRAHRRQRTRDYFLFGLFIAVVVSWGSFFVRPKDTSPRVSLGVGSAFAAAAFTVTINNALPDTNALTMADQLVILSLGSIVLTIAVSITSIRLFERGREDIQQRLDRAAAVVIPLIYLALLVWIAI